MKLSSNQPWALEGFWSSDMETGLSEHFLHPSCLECICLPGRWWCSFLQVVTLYLHLCPLIISGQSDEICEVAELTYYYNHCLTGPLGICPWTWWGMSLYEPLTWQRAIKIILLIFHVWLALIKCSLREEEISPLPQTPACLSQVSPNFLVLGKTGPWPCDKEKTMNI